MDDETGMTTTRSRGTCTDAGILLFCAATAGPLLVYCELLVYSVGAVATDLPAPNEELTEDSLLFFIVL